MDGSNEKSISVVDVESSKKEGRRKRVNHVNSNNNIDQIIQMSRSETSQGNNGNNNEINSDDQIDLLREPLISKDDDSHEEEEIHSDSLDVQKRNGITTTLTSSNTNVSKLMATDEIENGYMRINDELHNESKDDSDQLSYHHEDAFMNEYVADDDDNFYNEDESNGNDEQEVIPIATRWNIFLHKNHMYILFTAMILLVPLGVFSFPKFISSTDSTIHPIPYSSSDKAINRFRDAFGGGNSDEGNGKGGTGLVLNDPLNPGIVLLLEHHRNYDHNQTSTETFIDGRSELYRTSKNYTMELKNYLYQNLPVPSSCHSSSKPNMSNDNNKHRTLTNDHIIQPFVDITSYYSLQDENLESASYQFVAENGNVLLLYIRFTIPSCLYSSPRSSSSSSLFSSSSSIWTNYETNRFYNLITQSNKEHIQHNIQKSYTSSILSSIQTFSNKHILLDQQQQNTSSNQKESLFNVTMGYTGIVAFQEDLSTSVRKDIHRMHLLILPLSLVLLCLALEGHITLMIIPIFSVICVCCGWSIVMLIFIKFGFIQVTQFTPNVMMSLTIGLGIDYTLFLLSRVLTEISTLRERAGRLRRQRGDRLACHDYYNDSSFNHGWNRDVLEEERRDILNETTFNSSTNESREHLLQTPEVNDDEQRQRRMDEEDEAEERDIQYESITIMIRHAGQTVLISGITLMFTFLGLLLFPIHALHSISVGASVCIIFCLVVNLMVVPALLHSALGNKLLRMSRPRTGGTGMESMIGTAKSWVSSIRKKYKIWKYKAKRSRLNSSSSHQRTSEASASTNELNTLDTDSKDHKNANANERTEEDDNLEDPYSDENYTSFQDLLFHQEIGNGDSIKTQKKSNVSSTFNQYALNGELDGMDAVFLNRKLTLSDEEVKRNSADVDTTSFWYAFSSHLLHPTKSIIILVGILVVLFPITLQSRNIESTLSFESTLPSKSISMLTLKRLGDLFGKGHLSPYQLMFDGLNFDERIDTIEAFEVMQNAVQQIEQLPTNGSLQAHCTGIAWADGAISHTTYEAAKACSVIGCPIEKFREIVKLDSMSTTKDGLSTLFTCILTEDSFSNDAVAWLDQTRQELQVLKENGELRNYTVSVLGGASINHDAQEAVHESMVRMIVTTFFCVFVVIAFFFGSIVTPLRSVLSIAITLLSVYGLVALVYQKGTVSWLTVPMSFSIIVGLALDYDIFLINRVLEYRMSGYDHKSSIIAGLCSTGNIITAAGVIMAVSFGGLMFSESPVVYQWSFALTMAVLLDTFIMRSCVVPILLLKSGVFSWFPRSLPHSTISLEAQLFHEHDQILL